MRNCLILGSGRSGTSLLAGMLHHASYYMGSHLLPPNADNPTGFFEDREINSINEALLAQVTPRRPAVGDHHEEEGGDEVLWGWRWLAAVDLGIHIPLPGNVAQRIRRQVAQVPFCFKDPRFCFTLPVWRPLLPDTVFLCVFRQPSLTAHSIINVCRRGEYLHGLALDFRQAVDLWSLMYRHILDVHRHHGQWCFLHFDQLLNGEAHPLIERLTGVAPCASFVQPRQPQSTLCGDVGQTAQQLYVQLCELAVA